MDYNALLDSLGPVFHASLEPLLLEGFSDDDLRGRCRQSASAVDEFASRAALTLPEAASVLAVVAGILEVDAELTRRATVASVRARRSKEVARLRVSDRVRVVRPFVAVMHESSVLRGRERV